MADKYVILHSAVGVHRQGAVIDRDDLPPHADIARLFATKAMRIANEFERTQKVVKDAVFGPDKSLNEQLVEKEAQIKLLREQKDAIESAFSAFKAATKPSENGNVNVEDYKRRLAEKDAIIMELQKKARSK